MLGYLISEEMSLRTTVTRAAELIQTGKSGSQPLLSRKVKQLKQRNQK